MVPDLALLGIFDFYMTEALDFNPFRHNSEAWIILAHVCRKWRDIVFGSPSRLNVRLLFKSPEVREGDAGYLAALSYRHMGQRPQRVERG